jgi:hypothetical protein
VRFDADLTLRSTDSSRRGRRFGLRAAVIGSTILLAAAAAPLGALADTSDTTPPQLTSVQVLTPTLDVSYSPADLRLLVHATDAGSGVQSVQVDLFGPASNAYNQGDDVRGYCQLSSGTAKDGDWSCDVPVPRWSHSGTWHLSFFALDAVPNVGQYSPTDIAAHGWTNYFTVSGTQDVTPPQIDTVTASPSTAEQGQQVTISFAARDDMSGLGALEVDLRSPSGHWIYQLDCSLPWNAPTSFPTSANVTCTWTPPPGAEPGIWTVHVKLADGVNNLATVGQDDGTNSPSFTVTGVGDASPPVLTSFTAPTDPMNLWDSTDPYISVPATFTATDEGSGLRPDWAQVDLLSPSGKGMWAMNCSITAGDGSSATYSCTARLSRYAESGRWTFQHVWISDLAGNQVMYDVNGGSPSLLAITGSVPALNVLPGAPGTPTIAGGAGAAVASWTAAPVYGGQAIDSYTVTATPVVSAVHAGRTASVTAQPVSVTVPGSKTSASLPGLVTGVSYQLRVVAHNAGGSSLAATATVSAPAIQPSPTPTPTGTTHPTPAPHPTPSAGHPPAWGAPKAPAAPSPAKPTRGSGWGAPHPRFSPAR